MEKNNTSSANRKPADTARSQQTPEDAIDLHRQADRCRRLARSIGDQPTVDLLNHLADDYERMASELDIKGILDTRH